VLTDPHFLAVAIIAVIMLGLAKGGFTAIASISTPLVALLLPILMVQDLLWLWVYRGDWSARNLKLMLPGAVVGVGIAWMLAAYLSEAVVRLIIGGIGFAFVLNAWFG
jgi:hypothetical protein